MNQLYVTSSSQLATNNIRELAYKGYENGGKLKEWQIGMATGYVILRHVMVDNYSG